jgi:ATP-dependent RNA helicase DHX37/DHR1
MLLASLEMGKNMKEMGEKSKKMGEKSKLPKGSRKKGLRLLAHAIAAAAALSSESPFLREGFEGLGEKEGEGEGVGFKEKGELADDWDANERRAEKAKSKAADEEKERRRKRRSAARAAHAKFTVQGSEALSAAAALRAYEDAVAGAGERVSQTGPSAGERFCHENHLHARTMKEMAQLRQQLTRLVGANLGREEAAPDLEPGTSPSRDAAGKGPILNQAPAPASTRQSLEKQNIELLESALKEQLGRGEEAKLRRAVCAGWADRIARKLRPGESVPGETEESKSRWAVRYQACSAPGVVFLHPGSSMAKDAPDFVCYTDLIQTEKRTYMQVRAIVCCWPMVTSLFFGFLLGSVVSFFRNSCCSAKSPSEYVPSSLCLLLSPLLLCVAGLSSSSIRQITNPFNTAKRAF